MTTLSQTPNFRENIYTVWV